MEYAFAYGADAVYAGQPRYSLRVRNNDFTLDNLGKGIARAHELGKQFYVASNIAPHNSKIDTYMRDIEPVIGMQPDALIMSDPGLIMMVKDRWPDQVIHLSVQANVVNYASVEFWRRQGVSRIILSRELSLDEIAEIRQRCPEMEIEVFVHGALCIAYSGRCLLSGYINKRDPNQGTCTNACRWEYKTHEAKEDELGNSVHLYEPIAVQPVAAQDDPTLGVGAPTDKVFLLEDVSRPGEFMEATEDEHGTYIMNSKDLRAVQHVAELAKMGVHSLKIEGRTKSTYYVARTTQVYRRAIDEAVQGKPFDMNLMDELEALSNRGYTEGFLRRHLPREYQTYEQGSSFLGTQQVVGTITDTDNQWLTIDVKNKFAPGDQLELISPAGNIRFSASIMENRNGQAMDYAPGSGHIVRIPIPADLPKTLEHSYLTRILPTGG